MSNCIIKYRGKYRLRCPYDLNTNQFPRKLNGNFDDIDVYISCQKNIKIFHYGRSILEAYIPSAIRGKNIIKEIYKENDMDIIFDIVQLDKEIYFKFKSDNMELLEKYLKPKTSGANISPFSNKNLPRNKTYKIPEDDLIQYRNITQTIPQNRILELSHITTNFLKTLVNKKSTWQDIKNDMAIRMLKGKEYIHSLGKWDDYIIYLKENIT